MGFPSLVDGATTADDAPRRGGPGGRVATLRRVG